MCLKLAIHAARPTHLIIHVYDSIIAGARHLYPLAPILVRNAQLRPDVLLYSFVSCVSLEGRDSCT
jgi:hypothetical protein